MPVFSQDTPPSFIGMLTLDCLANFIVRLFEERASLKTTTDPSEKLQVLDSYNFSKKDVQEITEKFNTAQVEDLKVLPNVTLPSTASLKEAIQLLSCGSVQRIPVTDSQGKITNILSQSSIINYISHHIPELLGDSAKQTLSELNMLGTLAVVSANANQRAITTLATMLHYKYYSLGIVDPTETDSKNVILTMITLKDVEISFPDFERLLLSTFDFITLARQLHLKDINPTINCSESDSLEKVIKKFAATKIHRLFIRSEVTNDLSSILSLNHIIKFLEQRAN